MKKQVGAVCAGLLLIASPVNQCDAARTRHVRIEGYEAFRQGKMEAVAVSEDGSVGVGLASKALLANAGTQVWTLLRGPDGAIQAGTGSEGSVFRIDEGIDSGQVSHVFEYEVFALAAVKGRLFAAGAPNGTISEIAADGSVRTHFDTPEGIVWSLLPDSQGNLYAATGERGLLYRVRPDGEASVIYRPEDDHVVALAWSLGGKLIAGTDGRGLLLEIDPATGAPRVLYDALPTEISDIVVAADGTIFFAANGAIAAEQERPSPQAEGATPTGAVLFAVGGNGVARRLWQKPGETVHALALAPGGDLWVGTGSTAAIYRVSPTGEETLVWKPEEGQVLSLLPEGSDLYVGTGNPGRVYRLSPSARNEAWIQPEPVDAGGSVSWGRASWQVLDGTGKWEVRTRSGFTSHPDSSWSEWSEPLIDPEGSLITSPAARFLQCEARLVGHGPGGSARLRAISIPYSEANLAPRLGSLRLSPDDVTPGAAGGADAGYIQDLGGGVRVQFQRDPAAPPPDPAPEAPEWVRTVRSIIWEASDPNGDEMSFEIAIRQSGEERFRVLARDHPATSYALDTRTLPDGRYEILVAASDAPSNPPGESMRTERIAGPFRVDHRPPELVDLKVRAEGPMRIVVEGAAQDEASPIVRVEISLAGKAWRPASAQDGFFDSREERFRAEVGLEREEDAGWVAARAVDAAGNESVRRVWLAP
ncbi:MAG: hypothetical protein FJY88_00270 [Candidatus Eisenbacteria bacterium]|nr:hypothetical protein [Candidatus Eisenbacteria bacterium]